MKAKQNKSLAKGISDPDTLLRQSANEMPQPWDALGTNRTFCSSSVAHQNAKSQAESCTHPDRLPTEGHMAEYLQYRKVSYTVLT